MNKNSNRKHAKVSLCSKLLYRPCLIFYFFHKYNGLKFNMQIYPIQEIYLIKTAFTPMIAVNSTAQLKIGLEPAGICSIREKERLEQLFGQRRSLKSLELPTSLLQVFHFFPFPVK